ncbi:MAG TPA: SHOCT domain-containing protein [Candidatus Acidoferrales bacterium]|nr:SHOCT domain-containing protein [Candidatus Acidoferrales bacterium]
MYHYGFGGWGFPFEPLIWVAFWLIIIFLIFGRWGRHHRWDRYHNDSRKDMTAEEVLADRFAHGEIDEKEYEKRLAVLKKHAKS